MNYNYVFKFGSRKLDIVTDTISDALHYLQFREPRLRFDNLEYFVNMKTGEKTPAFNKRKIYVDKVKELARIKV